MDEVPAQGADAAIDAGCFMDLALAAPAALAAVEQAQHPVRIGIAVAEEPAEVLRQAGEAVTRMTCKTAVAGLLDGRAQFRADALVGVQAQYPVVAGLLDAERFLAAETIERALQHAGAGSLGDGYRGVGGQGVHHHDLVAEGQRGQAVADAPGLVERDNAGRDARPFDGSGRGGHDGRVPVVCDGALCAAYSRPVGAGLARFRPGSGGLVRRWCG
ncbi:hypothetical protein D3C73_1038740 [compost metagenome]